MKYKDVPQDLWHQYYARIHQREDINYTEEKQCIIVGEDWKQCPGMQLSIRQQRTWQDEGGDPRTMLLFTHVILFHIFSCE